MAAQRGCLEIVQFLLEKGLDSSLRDTTGHSPYDYANDEGYADIIQLFHTLDNSEESQKAE